MFELGSSANGFQNEKDRLSRILTLSTTGNGRAVSSFKSLIDQLCDSANLFLGLNSLLSVYLLICFSLFRKSKIQNIQQFFNRF